MRGVRFTTGFVVLLGVLCSTSAAVAGSDELAAHVDGWEKAFNAGDLAGIVALYTEDARLLPPNAGLAEGSEAIREIFGGWIESGMKGDLETVETGVDGDLGYRVGTYTVETADGSVADRGKFIEIWERVGGEWKITNDIWNSSMPAPESEDSDGGDPAGD